MRCAKSNALADAVGTCCALGGIASSPGAFYTPGKRGVDLLRRALEGDPADIRKPPNHRELSPLFLNHLLQINDFRVAVTVAARDNNLRAKVSPYSS